MTALYVLLAVLVGVLALMLFVVFYMLDVD